MCMCVHANKIKSNDGAFNLDSINYYKKETKFGH